MWETARTAFGEATTDEVVLVALFFVCVVLFSWAPRIGEAMGGLFEPSDREPPKP